jgi:hypothetical protein
VDQPKRKKTVENGIVRIGIDGNYRNLPNVLMLRIAGREAYITFNERNPDAVRLAAALKNLDAADMDRFTSQIAKYTRWIASVNTQYNPVFGVVNFIRDLSSGLINLSTTQLKGQQGAVFKEAARLLGHVARHGFRMDGLTGADQGLWQDFQAAGAKTGYRDNYRTAEDREEALLKELKALDRGKARQALYAVFDWLSDYNEALENVVRLAAYKTALDAGATSREGAASLAKNLTVNFNRRGNKTKSVNAWYAFMNASLQGTARMTETLRGPAGRKIIAGGIGLGALHTALVMAMMGAGGDDDEYRKIKDWVKERSLIIPTGRNTYIALPLPLGLHVLPNIGRLIVEGIHGGENYGIGKQTAKFATLLIDAYNPIGGGGNLSQTLLPTPLDMPVALWQNRDWSNRPIYREDTDSLHPTPGHKRTRDTASIFGKTLAREIGRISGGSDYRPGAIDWTPDQIDYVLGQLTGGTGREMVKLLQWGAAQFAGEEVPAYKTPLVSRFYGETTGAGAENEQFYENLQKLNMIEAEIKGRQRNGQGIDDYLKAEPRARLITMGSRMEQHVKKLRERRRDIHERARPGYREEVKAVDKLITDAMRYLNREVDRASR